MATDLTRAAGPNLRQGDYRRLASVLKDAELLGRSNWYHIWRIAANFLMWLAAWVAVIALGNSWYQLLIALVFAFVSVQTGFLAHDIGHGQIACSKRTTKVLGYIHANLLIGLSFGWWVQKHNRHHGRPNDVESDPDIMIGVLAFSEEQARDKRGIARFITSHQASFFLPLLLAEGTHIVVAGIRWLVTTHGRGHRIELLLVAMHFVLLLGLLSRVLSPLHLLAFLALQMGATGLYSGLVFAPNHKGMPMTTGSDRVDYLRRQVLTARNVRPGPVTDFVYGGLNYQVEHHLFPTIGRNRLRQTRLLVQEFCRQNDIDYHEVGVVQAFREVFKELHRLGRSVRKGEDTPSHIRRAGLPTKPDAHVDIV